jgi:hypothetical protein
MPRSGHFGQIVAFYHHASRLWKGSCNASTLGEEGYNPITREMWQVDRDAWHHRETQRQPKHRIRSKLMAQEITQGMIVTKDGEPTRYLVDACNPQSRMASLVLVESGHGVGGGWSFDRLTPVPTIPNARDQMELDLPFAAHYTEGNDVVKPRD